MQASTILALYVALAALDLAWGLFLRLLNHRSVSSSGARVPPELEGRVSPEDAARAGAYTLARSRLSLVSEPVTTAVVVFAAVLGLFGLLDRAVCALAAGEYWRGALFLGVLAALSGLLALPFSAYTTFALEKRYGFNTTTVKTWLLDGAKNAVISAALALPLLWVLYAFMDAAGGSWWIWAAAVFSALSVLVSILYPLVIAPLFNSFTPLPDGPLRDRIRALADRVGLGMSGVFVMDGSKRSRHSNAYFTGLGRVKRVVLYDTLVESLGEDEVLAVLAHEIGHEKRRHVLKGTLLSIALFFAGFYILNLLAEWPELYAAFGFLKGRKPAPTREALLLIYALLSGPATFLLTPLASAWSRSREYQADAFAVQAVDAVNTDPSSGAVTGREAFSSALITLSRGNASNLWPHPWYSFWYYTHPTLLERLRALR